jgi:hypothetical protein
VCIDRFEPAAHLPEHPPNAGMGRIALAKAGAARAVTTAVLPNGFEGEIRDNGFYVKSS